MVWWIDDQYLPHIPSSPAHLLSARDSHSSSSCSCGGIWCWARSCAVRTHCNFWDFENSKSYFRMLREIQNSTARQDHHNMRVIQPLDLRWLRLMQWYLKHQFFAEVLVYRTIIITIPRDLLTNSTQYSPSLSMLLVSMSPPILTTSLKVYVVRSHHHHHHHHHFITHHYFISLFWS